MRRDYRSDKGVKLPGVTNILEVLAKPALVFWGYKQGKWNFDEVTERIMGCFSTPAWQESPSFALEQIKKIISDFPVRPLYEQRDKAATAGTLAHQMIEVYLSQDKEGPYVDYSGYPEDVVKKAQACFGSFKEWAKSHEFRIIGNEVPLVSKLGFGGTMDLGIVTSELNLMDYKTSKDIYFSYRVQLAGYGFLWDENHPDNLVKGYRILQLGDGEFSELYIKDLTPEREIFLSALNIYKTLRQTGQKL